MKIRYKRLRLDLAFTWAIARNSSDYKENFIVELSQDEHIGFGEVAPNIRYNELPDRVEAILKKWQTLEWDSAQVEKHRLDTSIPACLRMGLDAAYRMLLANQKGLWLSDVLQTNEMDASYPVSFTLPILPVEAIEPFFVEFGLARFPYLKVKVGKQGQDEVFSELGRLYTGPVLVDGNEGFTSIDELDRHISYWQKHVLLAAVEQPFPSDNLAIMQSIKGLYPFPLVADESVQYGANIENLASGFDGINIKLQKTGSYSEALRQKNEANNMGLKIMIGCMVETSIGIWQGLQLAHGVDFVDLDSMLYLQKEPFGWVTEEKGRLYPAKILHNPFRPQ